MRSTRGRQRVEFPSTYRIVRRTYKDTGYDWLVDWDDEVLFEGTTTWSVVLKVARPLGILRQNKRMHEVIVR